MNPPHLATTRCSRTTPFGQSLCKLAQHETLPSANDAGVATRKRSGFYWWQHQSPKEPLCVAFPMLKKIRAINAAAAVAGGSSESNHKILCPLLRLRKLTPPIVLRHGLKFQPKPQAVKCVCWPIRTIATVRRALVALPKVMATAKH